MKKIFYFITAMMLLTSCCASVEENTYRTTPTHDKIKNEFGTFSIHRLQYGNHTYIILKGTEQVALEHDPDCPCHYNF